MNYIKKVRKISKQSLIMIFKGLDLQRAAKLLISDIVRFFADYLPSIYEP